MWFDVKSLSNWLTVLLMDIVGMLWTGGTPEAKQIEENMMAYFNVLQGFILLSHGSTVDTGPTLSSSIHVSVKQVVDSSFKLMMESVSLYGNPSFPATLSQLHDIYI